MMTKRLFDIVCSSVGLIVLAPIFVAIAIAIRLESPGPILFRQVRIGRNCVPFRIHKFRTMTDSLNPRAPQITIGHDPRITRVGYALRKFKIDELPQLIDVLIGKMSIVGPRPEVPKYVDFYDQQVKEKIFAVRPGITDESSIFFIDESSLLEKQADPERYYIDQLIPLKNKHHLHYVENMSVMKDLHIIASTFRRIVSR